MALWIKVTDAGVVNETVTPANGRSFRLQELQRMVGGYIEALQLNDGRVMWLNEEGKLQGLPKNVAATTLATMYSQLPRSDYIVGNVVIATRSESGEDEDEDEDD